MTKSGYRFSLRVDNYIKYRPRYPEAILDLLKVKCQLNADHTIADIGSGTGILSELFLKNGNRVIGVEPDPDMRAGGEYYLREFANFTSVAATSEATTLADRSVDFVAAGQAFHWFDIESTRREFKRILARPGWVVLVWNIQRATGTPFLEALQEFWEDGRFSKFSSQQAADRMARAQAGRLNPELVRQELLDPFFGPGACRETIFENPIKVDFEGLRGRILSNAPALEPGDAHYEAMIARLAEIFQAHQENGMVTIEHDTRVVIGQLLTRD